MAQALFDFGGFVFAGAGLVIGALTLYATILAFRAERYQKRIEADLRRLEELEKKVNNTLILASDLVLTGLPQITFTQQIPAAIIDDVGVIEEIFDPPGGDELWADVSKRKRVARLAYARAIYNLGRDPTNVVSLKGGFGNDTKAVARLLEVASRRIGESPNDPMSLQRDIMVRRVQCFRQAEDYESAVLASKELDSLDDDRIARVLGPWCRTLVRLQEGFREWDPNKRKVLFAEAVHHLSGPFTRIFGQSGELLDGPARISAYQTDWPGVELGSIAYYYAKALTAYRYACEATDGIAPPELTPKLFRALDLSLLFYENARRQDIADQMTLCIYNLCVPLITAIIRALPEGAVETPDFDAAYPELSDQSALAEHARSLLVACTKQIEKPLQGHRNNGAYIYSEKTERIDHISRFRQDLVMVRDALDDRVKLREIFVNPAGGYE